MFANVFEVFDVDVVRSCGVVVFAVLMAVCTCSVVMIICVGCSLRTFLVVFLFVVLVL